MRYKCRHCGDEIAWSEGWYHVLTEDVYCDYELPKAEPVLA